MNWKEQELISKSIERLETLPESRLINTVIEDLKSIQAAALPKSEEEIKKLAEQEYPTEDARKNMFHDNLGQYERQEAFIKGFKAALPVKEEPKEAAIKNPE